MNTSSTRYVVPCRSRWLYKLACVLVYGVCPALVVCGAVALWMYFR